MPGNLIVGSTAGQLSPKPALESLRVRSSSRSTSYLSRLSNPSRNSMVSNLVSLGQHQPVISEPSQPSGSSLFRQHIRVLSLQNDQRFALVAAAVGNRTHRAPFRSRWSVRKRDSCHSSRRTRLRLGSPLRSLRYLPFLHLYGENLEVICIAMLLSIDMWITTART